MKKFCLVIGSILFTLLPSFTICQLVECPTSHIEFSDSEFYSLQNDFEPNEPVQIRLSFHVIADDQGSGGISQEIIENYVIPSVEAFYAPLNISFCLEKYTQTNSSEWYDYATGENSSAFIEELKDIPLWQAKLSPRSIDCFVINSQFPPPGILAYSAGKAEVQYGYCVSECSEIPEQNPNISSNFVLAHEIGHCLGLMHVNNPTQEADFFGFPVCQELVNGDETNRAECGDKVSDTPAAPSGFGFTTFDEELGVCLNDDCIEPCLDLNGDAFNPVVNNLMWGKEINSFCGPHLSQGQGERIRWVLNNVDYIGNYAVVEDQVTEPIGLNITDPVYYADQTLYLTGITFDEGAIAEFDNCVLIMDNNARIELNPTSHLILNNCIIRPREQCGVQNVWQGIFMRTANSHLIEGNYIELIPHLEISDCNISGAEYAISSTTTPSAYIEQSGFINPNAGGNVQISNTQFLNNRYDLISVKGAQSPTISNFEITDSGFYVDGSYPFQGEKPANIYNQSWEIQIRGSEFRNFYSSLPAHAILSVNGGLDIRSSEQSNCSFEGFYYAIEARQAYGIQLINVEDCDFRNNFRGVYLDGTIYSVLTGNFFERSIDTPYEFIDFVDLEDEFEYFVYLNQCDAFDARGNVFTGSSNVDLPYDPQTQYTDFGIMLNNCGNNSNVIRDNSFYYLTHSIVALNDNLYTSINSPGLLFECNFFDRSFDKHIWVTKDAEFESPFGISQIQGSPTLSAGNSFASGTEASDIYNSGVNVDYYQTANYPFTTTNTFGVNNVIIDDEFENSCDHTTETEFNFEQLINEKDVLNQEFDDLLDGGNTDNLTLEVINSDYSEAINLTYNLLSKSPFLSEKVLLEALDKEFDLPNPLLVEILQANPWAIKTEKIEEKIEEKLIPFSQFEKELILEGLSIVSEKERLISELSQTNRKIDELFTQNIVEELKDSEEIKSTIVFYSDLHPSERNRISLLMLLSDQKFVSNEVLALPLLENLNQREQQYLSLVESMHDLSVNPELAEGFEQLINDHDFLAGRSRNLYRIIYPTSYSEPSPVLMPPSFENRSRKISEKKETLLFPNPSQGTFTITTPAGQSSDLLDLRVNSVDGKNIPVSDRLNHPQGITVFLEVQPGLYTVELYLSNEKRTVETFVVLVK